VIASVGEVAMFFAISNFTAVNRAALFAARVAVGAAVRSGDGGIWGVSDPLCHPPDPVPGPVGRESLTPQMHVAIVRQNRALSLPSPNAPLVSDAVSTSFASTASASVRFFRITAFIYMNAHSH
jgi:hypothetical protein